MDLRLSLRSSFILNEKKAGIAPGEQPGTADLLKCEHADG
jgi:hypothetical protein